MGGRTGPNLEGGDLDSPQRLERVASIPKCAECDAGALISISLEDAKRCWFSDPDEDLENGP